MAEEDRARKIGGAYRALFFRAWLRHPLNVSAIAPTSRSAARLMTTDLARGHCVVELGAGTGTISAAILDAGVRPQDLFLIELNPQFASILKSRFPDARVLQADAVAMLDQLSSLSGDVDFVISGLPILWFGRTKQTRILENSLDLLKPDGCFHQITYWARPPFSHDLLLDFDLKTSLLGFSPFNLPPAFAFRWRRACATDAAPRTTSIPSPSSHIPDLATSKALAHGRRSIR